MNGFTSLLPYALLDWDIGSFLMNLTAKVKEWGGYLIILLGVVMIIVGVCKLAAKLWSKGQSQTHWGTVIALILVGGALMAGGFTLVATIAEGGKKTIMDIGGTVLLPMIQSFPRFF